MSSSAKIALIDEAAYRRDGFLFPLDVFASNEAAALAEKILNLPQSELAAHPAPWVQKSYLLLPSLDRLLFDRRLTDRVAAILGEDLLVLSADLFIKPPRLAKRITWHQDVNYWGLEPLEVLTAWIAFTAATPENGCMLYARGGHLARLEHIENKSEDNMLTRGQEIAVRVDPASIVEVRLAPGQVSFHDGLTPHASGPNTTDRTRIGFAIRFSPTHVRQTSGPPISARLVRGSDKFGHFALEEGPDAPLSPRARAAHLRALSPHATTNYSTV
jgi:ectoine hydroxylase-related dioxygenase (phytanoyl-CoA dioxygenase family)